MLPKCQETVLCSRDALVRKKHRGQRLVAADFLNGGRIQPELIADNKALLSIPAEPVRPVVGKALQADFVLFADFPQNLHKT